MQLLRRRNRYGVLSQECEERGTDATGFAYNSRGKLTVFKRPFAAHNVHLKLREDANVIMGHTRMATQGNKLDNRKRYMILFSVNGKMYYYSGDDFTKKIKVACGESEETDRPILLIKTNVADNLFNDDENSVIVQPEMFVAKIEIADDNEAPGDTLTANFSYFAAFDKLSCNTALEVPDSNATNYLFDAFSSLLIYTSKALADKEMEEV